MRDMPPWLIVALAAAAYFVLHRLAPQLLAHRAELAPAAKMSAAAAPLAALLFLFPLTGSMWRAARERRLVRKLRSLDSLRGLDWNELEKLVCAIFRRQGFKVSLRGGGGPDGGVDVVLRRSRRTLLVQCKQWKSKHVGVGVVRELAGIVAVQGVHGGIVVTCGSFTKDARQFAQKSGIVLIDGAGLIRMRSDMRFEMSAAPAPRTDGAEANGSGCPLCGAIMVRRSAKPGHNGAAGGNFLGCSNYPACRGSRSA
jgi:restriction system protein